MGYKVGIDVGGTFTDLILERPDGTLHMDKTFTTPRELTQGVMNGLEALAKHERLSTRQFLSQVDLLIHGTTTCDNTMVQMNGAKCGLITTQGFRDELELRRGYKEDIWAPTAPPPPVICPRRYRIGVPERLDFQGRVLVPLDEESVRKAARRLKVGGVESIAVVFLFSFLNNSHENRAAEIIREEYPGVRISLSHEVMPKAPEFDRCSTTVVNAYLAPRVGTYVEALNKRLHDNGFGRDLFLMQSSGGVMKAETVAQRAVSILGSGPAGGVMGSCYLMKMVGQENFISVDMGGTSYDACLVNGGRPAIESYWNWQHRYLVGLPMVDVYSVGAGGGSIAYLQSGALRVGPKSAGSEPGPVCYGRGGTQPTVTDANLVLGYLNPDYFAAGTVKLNVEAARKAIEENLAMPLGKSVVEAAHGIFEIVNANMTAAVRRISSEKGLDPREFALVVFGGNGAVHAGMQAADLGMRRIVVPKLAPAFCALGLLAADYTVDRLQTYVSSVDKIDLELVNLHFSRMAEEAAGELAAANVTRDRVRFEYIFGMCYPGQIFETEVEAITKHGTLGAKELAATVDRFHTVYEQRHTYALRQEVPVVRNLRLRATGVSMKPRLARASRIAGPDSSSALKGRRDAYFDGGLMSAPLYDGGKLCAGHIVDGPAIVEETYTTIVLFPGQRAEVDEYSNYMVHL